jgi:outer membrane lipoprotein carrier protein
VLLLLLPIASFAQPEPTAQQVAQRVDKYYNGLHSLRTAFTESFHGMGIDREESGILLLRKPGKMRWSYTNPVGKVFLLDGNWTTCARPYASCWDIRNCRRNSMG